MSKKNNDLDFFWIKKKRKKDKKGPFHYKNANSFYASPHWIRLRLYKLSLDPFCERCETRNLVVAAEQVHHIREVEIAPDLALDLNNLESICGTCHSRENYKYLTAPKLSPGQIVNYKSKYIDSNR